MCSVGDGVLTYQQGLCCLELTSGSEKIWVQYTHISLNYEGCSESNASYLFPWKLQ